jgi:hypothetical protein
MEFHATYEFACADMGGLTGLRFDYFKRFPAAEELDVNIIGPKGQASREVDGEAPMLSLEGLL